MITNQVLQTTIDGTKNISRVELSILDTEGKELATSFAVEYVFGDMIDNFIDSPADSQMIQGFQFFKVFDENSLEYIVVAKGSSEDVYMIGKMVAFQIQSLIIAYKERFDKDNFIKNLLLDNLLLVDIYNRAKKLNIDPNAKRIVYIINHDNKTVDDTFFESVKTELSDMPIDFITNLDDKSLIYIKQLDNNVTMNDLYDMAEGIRNFISSNFSKNVKVVYGTVVSDIKDISRSYKEAKMALDVSNIFYEDMFIVPYTNLGIGRLIYQLPVSLCKMFIKEIFDINTPDKFDEETMFTIDKFFENSLNVSETSRQLYIHRNTLVYRLDKLKKLTNLDIRIFDDAITFKIAMMVVKYMHYIENNDGEHWR